MKRIQKYIGNFGFTLALMTATPAAAQFMPVVYDRTYDKETRFETVSADFANGDFVAAGESRGRMSLTWLDRQGGQRVFKRFATDDSNISAVWCPARTSRFWFSEAVRSPKRSAAKARDVPWFSTSRVLSSGMC